MLHIPDYQVASPAGIAFLQKRKEILPLYKGRVLELVKQKVLIPDAKFLVNERSIGTIDYIPEQGIGIIYAEDIPLLHNILQIFLKDAG